MCIRDRYKALVGKLEKIAGYVAEAQLPSEEKKEAWLDSNQLAVSYTHLDVYKRQIPYCTFCFYAYFTIRFLKIFPTRSAASVVFSNSCIKMCIRDR